ncbi:MAG: pyridoxamine 5'-phosphate oxidase family protein [Rhodocyclales bacterium]|nr:pyridoxamine 5'-phosphate oxidase family protein [Rhodocyclales bacterium]
MKDKITATLPDKLIDYLLPGAPALMLTTGTDGYASSAYAWVVAIDATRLRFAVDLGSSAMENLQRSGQVSIQIIGPGDVSFLVKGEARLIKDRIEAAAPAPIMLWEMDVVAVKDQSWAGVTTTALAYEWPAAQRETMLRMEQAVYDEMRAEMRDLR